jgi:hypothetical protein
VRATQPQFVVERLDADVVALGAVLDALPHLAADLVGHGSLPFSATMPSTQYGAASHS